MTERLAGGATPRVQKNRASRGKRIPATELIAREGWKIGDTLTHDSWKTTRVIEAIAGGDVKMRSPSRGGYSWPASLPSDTTKVEDAA